MEKENKEEVKMSLFEKLLEIRKKVEILKKENSGDGIKYKYVNEEQILLQIKETMNSLKLLLLPNIIQGSIQTKDFQYELNSGKSKKEVITSADMSYTWIDIETGEKLETNWAMFGQNASASQSFGSGLTYANKYYLLKFFNIATTDDDPDKLVQEQEEKERRKTISQEQTKSKKSFTKLLKIYQTNDKVYSTLGTTKEKFMEKYNDEEGIKELNEQMELLLNDNN